MTQSKPGTRALVWTESKNYGSKAAILISLQTEVFGLSYMFWSKPRPIQGCSLLSISLFKA